MTEWLSVDAGVGSRGFQARLGIAEGQSLAVIGPNGAGKSTLLDLIAGSLRPTAGSVRIGGEEVSGAQRHLPPHRRRVSYVEQRPLLFPHLNIVANVAFGPRARGASKAAACRRALAELEAVGCADLASCMPGRLSGGQAQRVALARALAAEPDVVLLDEPFGALDVTVTPELRRLLRERLRGQTTVLVTHDLVDVVALADQMVELADGLVVAEGRVDDLFQAPSTSFLADFVGVNLLHGRGDGNRVWLDEVTAVTGLGGGLAGPARAVFAPSAVSLFREAPQGSPRNRFDVVVVGVEDRRWGQQVTLKVAGQRLAADITAAAAVELGLAAGCSLTATIKATEVSLHPSPGGSPSKGA